MDGLSDTIASATERFDAIERSRERAMALSRAVIRKTKNMIHAIHIGEDCSIIRAELIDDVRSMKDELASEPDALNSTYVEDAMMEYSEALILDSVLMDGTVPSYMNMGISPKEWSMGLADVIGELRRVVMTRLMEGNIDEAKLRFGQMEEIYNAVMSFDVRDSVAPIRRKQDIARGVMEKTRSDVANAIVMNSLKNQLK